MVEPGAIVSKREASSAASSSSLAQTHPGGSAGGPVLVGQASGDPRRPAGGDDLVIGIGNPLRGDDGVGRWLARRGELWLPQAQWRAVQQLTPELAADVAAAARVLFIDAWLVPDGGGLASTAEHNGREAGAGRSTRGAEIVRSAKQSGVRADGMAQAPWIPVVRSLEPATQAGIGACETLGAFSHQLSPGQLLGITQLLLGRKPEAWQLLVPAFGLGHGEGFSPQLTRLLPGAERLLRQWFQRNGNFTTADRA